MSRVVVVGGGFAGLATSVRLAKLGHDVILLEAATELGGAVRAVRASGFTWDAGPAWTPLPAVVRDLFRKSGRPVEAELGELVPLEVIREHRFDDRTSVRLVGGSRSAQRAAFDELGPGLGERWESWIDSFAPVWETCDARTSRSPGPPTTCRPTRPRCSTPARCSTADCGAPSATTGWP